MLYRITYVWDIMSWCSQFFIHTPCCGGSIPHSTPGRSPAPLPLKRPQQSKQEKSRELVDSSSGGSNLSATWLWRLFLEFYGVRARTTSVAGATVAEAAGASPFSVSGEVSA